MNTFDTNQLLKGFLKWNFLPPNDFRAVWESPAPPCKYVCHPDMLSWIDFNLAVYSMSVCVCVFFPRLHLKVLQIVWQQELREAVQRCPSPYLFVFLIKKKKRKKVFLFSFRQTWQRRHFSCTGCLPDVCRLRAAVDKDCAIGNFITMKCQTHYTV